MGVRVRRENLSTVFHLLAFLTIILSPSVFAAPEPMSLEQVLKSTITSNGQIQESLQDVEAARAQLSQAHAAMWPRATATVLAAPIFEETGNAVKSNSNWSRWGPFITGGVQIVQPLYTFGQISSYKKAAENQITAKSELASVKRDEMVMTAKEFYYSYQMATDLEALVDDLISFLDEAVTTAEESLNKKKKGGTAVKPHDVFRLKSALEDLRQKKLYATQGRQTAERAVAWVAGLPSVKIPKGAMKAEPFEKKTLEQYLAIAKAKRPEFRALAAGQEARLALRDAKRAQSYPVFFVGAFGSAGWSPVREKQQSIFALDPFNRVEGGAGFGLKFDLEFARHSAEAAEQEAEAMKLKAKESYAVPGIELQVKKAFWELEQAVTGLEVAERRKAIGKKWFVGSAMGWSIGITPAKDLLEALEGNGLAKKNYVETVFSYNMALGRLSQAIGEEVTGLRYR